MHPALTLGLLLATVLPAVSVAQSIPFSQHGSVTQRVAYTDVAIEYNRPTARGRLLFGDSAEGAIVRFGRTWHPGADSATFIQLSRDVVFEGTPLKAGTYSIWLIPQRNAPWTVILNAAARVFHQPYPGEATDVLRVQITPVRGEHMEALAYYFPVVGRDSTVLRMHWGTTVLPMNLKMSRDP